MRLSAVGIGTVFVSVWALRLLPSVYFTWLFPRLENWSVLSWRLKKDPLQNPTLHSGCSFLLSGFCPVNSSLLSYPFTRLPLLNSVTGPSSVQVHLIVMQSPASLWTGYCGSNSAHPVYYLLGNTTLNCTISNSLKSIVL